MPAQEETANLLDDISDLGGKEVWLVQIPRNFDLKTALVQDNFEISENNSIYTLKKQEPLVQKQLRVLVASKNRLKLSKVEIAGVATVLKKIPLPEHDWEKEYSPRPTVPPVETLKMRHFATGYGSKLFGVDPAAKHGFNKRKLDETESDPNSKLSMNKAGSHKEKKSKRKHE